MSLWFEWDSNKAASNERKHGISFSEAATVFGDPDALTIEDPSRSHEEQRRVTIGTSENGQVTLVVHTERGDNIRIISARAPSRKERKQYHDRKTEKENGT